LFSDKWHEWMHQTQGTIQRGRQDVRGLSGAVRVFHRWLAGFDVPVAEVSPEEVVARSGMLIKPIVRKRIVGFIDRSQESRADPRRCPTTWTSCGLHRPAPSNG